MTILMPPCEYCKMKPYEHPYKLKNALANTCEKYIQTCINCHEPEVCHSFGELLIRTFEPTENIRICKKFGEVKI